MYRAPSEYNSEDLPFKPSVSRSGQEITPFPWKLSLCVCVFFFPSLIPENYFTTFFFLEVLLYEQEEFRSLNSLIRSISGLL